MFKTRYIPLKDVYHTGAEMKRLATQYNSDVAAFDSYSLPGFFRAVAELTYRPDPKKMEHVSRPGAILLAGCQYRDCDDKSILLGAGLYRRRIPFRYVAVTSKPDRVLSHVLTEAMIRGNPEIIDPTYPHNRIFERKKYTAWKPITDWIYNGNSGNS